MEETTLVLKLNNKELVRLGLSITNEISKIENGYLYSIKDENTIVQYNVMHSLFQKFSEALIKANK